VDYEELAGGGRPASASTASAMTIADLSPRLALQRLLMLYENGDHREAAAFLRRLSPSTFKALLPIIPADLFIESMPHSLPILEALYSKLFLAGDAIWAEQRSTSTLRPEAVVWQMVRFFASQEDGLVGQMRWDFCGPFISSCKRLLSVLLSAEPRVRRLLTERKKALQRAIEGLGQHGMVGTTDQRLMNLHDALKLEFQKVQQTYRDSLEQLDDLALVVGKVGKGQVSGHGKAPIAQSHQRQLSLKADEVQERLIKNKTLLNVVEPTLENTSLEVLLGILQQRIELDKECMFQYTQLRKEVRVVDGQTSIAPVLMRYQRGCQQVLELMREVTEEGEDEGNISDSPYHSDEGDCSSVMMSGNSPFISKAARYNFLSRSVRLGSKHNVRASILASSLSQVNLELGSVRGSSTGPPSFVLHSSSGVSSGSGSSDTASNEDKTESPLSPAPSVGSSATVKRRPGEVRPAAARPRHLKPKKEVFKAGEAACNKCDKEEDPYQSILEVDTKKTEDAAAAQLKAEVARLTAELGKARGAVAELQKEEVVVREALEKERRKRREVGKTPTLSPADKRPAALVRKYGELYAQNRLETLDCLDRLTELDQHDDLKSKLLFSVIVLSFRSISTTVETKRDQVRRVLQLPPGSSGTADPAARELEVALTAYLRRATETFDLSKNVEEVCTQIWATLYDYPSLKSCDGLIKYIKECVRTAWGLTNQTPAYTIEYETRSFKPDLHVRFHSSSTSVEGISTYLWPSLIEGTGGPCVQKGVVVT